MKTSVMQQRNRLPKLEHVDTQHEERIDCLRRMPKLHECELPLGMSLYRTKPHTTIIEGLVVQGFVLILESPGEPRRYFTSRYLIGPPDLLQLRWAVGDFKRLLSRQGVEVDWNESVVQPRWERRPERLVFSSEARDRVLNVHETYLVQAKHVMDGNGKNNGVLTVKDYVRRTA